MLGRLRPVRFTVFALTLLCVAMPVGYLFMGSFRNAPPGAPDSSLTFANWIAVYGGERYWAALVNSAALCTTVALLSVVVGGLLAWILARTDAPFRRPLAVLMVVPLMISNLITALAWVALAAPNAGFLNIAARDWFGIQTAVNIYTFSGITLVFVLHYASLAFVALYSALQSIDGSLEEACYSIGAGPLRTTFSTTLPLVWPATAATFLLILVFAAENFSVPMLLGGRVGFHTLASWVYMDMTGEPARPTLGATAGIALLWIGLAGTLWQRHITRNAARYVTIGGKGGRPRITQLGVWRYAATALVGFYLFVAVALPYATLGLGSFLRFVTPRITLASFTTANYSNLFNLDNILPVYNSLLLAGVGGLAATVAYVLIAYLIKRSPQRLSAIMDYGVIIPTAIPALALGVGFVWALVGLPLPIYGTIWALVIAYFTRFLGIGVRHSRAAFTQVSDELVDAARVCGASPARGFRDVMLPLLHPALISLWTILFIFIFMEISITIMLYTPDTITLPVLLWSRMSSGSQTQAFAVAMVQTTLVLAMLYVANRLFGTLRTTLSS
jgi:iron(III) transport system permease protein